MEGAKELQWATDRVSQHDRYDRSLFYLFDLAFGGYTIISSQLESLTHLKDMASHGVSNHLLGAFKKKWCVFYDSYALAVLLVHWQGSLQPGLLGMTHKPRRSALWGRKMLALSAPPSPWAAAAPRCFAAAINPNHRQWQAHRHVCLALVIFRWTALKTLVMILVDYTTWNKLLHCGI